MVRFGIDLKDGRVLCVHGMGAGYRSQHRRQSTNDAWVIHGGGSEQK